MRNSWIVYHHVEQNCKIVNLYMKIVRSRIHKAPDKIEKNVLTTEEESKVMIFFNLTAYS